VVSRSRSVLSPIASFLTGGARAVPDERRALALAFLCNFVLLGSYYILRPVRDTVATVFGVDSLQLLFTGTFVGTLIASPIYSIIATRVTLRRLLPGMFWFWLLNVLLFQVLFSIAPQSRPLAAAYYIWFSVANLFMVSVFWTLMVDLFSAAQATRLFAIIAAGGSLGAIAGPVITRFTVHSAGLGGLLFMAAGGFLVVIVLVHLLMHEKDRLRASGAPVQHSRLDHRLGDNPFQGFRELFASAYSRQQALFVLLMTWVNTVAYFLQTEVVARSVSGIAGRVVAIADIALVVNIGSAAVLILGVGRFVQRFGVTAGLVLNPIIMLVAYVCIALSPTLLTLQALQITRQISQFAIARPSREICFTVVAQDSRYRTKNIIDTLVYRFGDLSAAWIEAGLRSVGLRVLGAAATGFGFCVLWGAGALVLGRRYEIARRRAQAVVPRPPEDSPGPDAVVPGGRRL